MKKSILVLFCLVLLLSAACKKEEYEVFGVWRCEFTINGVQGRETLTIQRDHTFTDLFEALIGGNWVFLPQNHSSRGTFTQAGNQLTITILYKNYDGANWHDPVDPPEIEVATFQFTDKGNTLTLQVDLNDDGDCLDERETVTYTRLS